MRDIDDTLDETLLEWIERRTRASSTGFLDADTVLSIYEEETGCESDILTIQRILASLYLCVKDPDTDTNLGFRAHII